MKRVIDGVLYNTATAEKLGGDSYGYAGDFSAWDEDLYRTKAGRYFLFGEGGPMTRYAVNVGQNQTCGGERIIPMTRQEAVEWAEKHLSGDNYIRAFGAPEQGVEEVRARLPAVLVARLRNKAEEMEVSMSALILDMVTMYVK